MFPDPTVCMYVCIRYTYGRLLHVIIYPLPIFLACEFQAPMGAYLVHCGNRVL